MHSTIRFIVSFAAASLLPGANSAQQPKIEGKDYPFEWNWGGRASSLNLPVDITRPIGLGVKANLTNREDRLSRHGGRINNVLPLLLSEWANPVCVFCLSSLSGVALGQMNYPGAQAKSKTVARQVHWLGSLIRLGKMAKRAWPDGQLYQRRELVSLLLATYNLGRLVQQAK